jgi:hypothetical protein
MSLIIPNIFAPRTGSIQLSELDQNFTYLGSQLDLTNVGVNNLNSTISVDDGVTTISGTSVVLTNPLSKTSGGTGVTQSRQLAQIVYLQTGASLAAQTGVFATGAIPTITGGNQFLSQAFTPISDTSLLEIEVSTYIQPSAIQWVTVALFKVGTTNALTSHVYYESIATAGRNSQIKYYMTSGSTSTMTFTVRAGAAAGNVSFNGLSGGVQNSYISIKEWLA